MFLTGRLIKVQKQVQNSGLKIDDLKNLKEFSYISVNFKMLIVLDVTKAVTFGAYKIWNSYRHLQLF